MLSDRPVDPSAAYVLYWMQAHRRAASNFALAHAAARANDLRLPLVVYEGLRHDYPWASDRLHTFILEGVEEKRAALAALGARYVFYARRSARDPRDTLRRLASQAALVVTDDFPTFVVPRHNQRAVEQVAVRVEAVDANGVVPLACFDREEYAAYTLRPKITRLLPAYLDPPPEPTLAVRRPDLPVDCPEETRDTSQAAIPRLVASSDLDHSVAPSPLYRGGRARGLARLRHFVERVLPRYADLRNDPSTDGTSRLSAYLHFGFLSAHDVVGAVLASGAPPAARAAFLEEMVVRRELAFNMARFNPAHTSLDAAPAWAQASMRRHASDPRPRLPTRAAIEGARTGDALWDAAQRELVRTGEIHNYVRMLWGKLVIAWCATYAEAFALLEDLNNRYALDGRDPNSYAGILWCFGKHDRAWGPERPIYGTLRYMTSRSMARKFDARAYARWTEGFAPATVEQAAAE